MRGGTLIEVLVSILILSFGLLSIGAMLAYAVQLPKVSGNRAVASSMAIDLVERMRANVTAYQASNYSISTYDGKTTDLAEDASKQCAYPACTSQTLATQDLNEISRNLRKLLPAGGLVVEAPNAASGEGRIFVVWKEAASAGSLGGNNDICPTLSLGAGENAPRCLMVKFKP
jgi:type IV pilus assembly protein PilV